MKRLTSFVLTLAVAMTFIGEPASPMVNAQDGNYQVATEIAELQKRVAALETQVAPPPVASPVAGGVYSDDEEGGGTGRVSSDDIGTRAKPIPVGTPGEVAEGWSVTVIDVTPRAGKLVLEENRFNDPPARGHRFYMVTISAVYNGEKESHAVPYSVRLSAVGQSAIAYGDGCGVIPNELSSTEVFRGGTIEGNVCWSIKSEDAASLVMYAEPSFSLDEERIFFSLQERQA